MLKGKELKHLGKRKEERKGKGGVDKVPGDVIYWAKRKSARSQFHVPAERSGKEEESRRSELGCSIIFYVT